MRKLNTYVIILAMVLQGFCSCKNPGGLTAAAVTSIAWDQGSLQQIGLPTGENNRYYSYPRMRQMAGGALLCVYEHNGNIEIIQSSDKGVHWSQPSMIATATGGINASTPEMIQLQNGTIVVAYNRRPQPLAGGNYDPAKRFSICIKRSADAGATWSNEQVLYEAGSDFKNGCWEPAMLQLPNGMLQLYFSNEGIYTETDEQNISVLSSGDNGLSWTKDPLIVSFSKGFRDGMPVPVYDKKRNEVFVAIEDNSNGITFNPSVIRLPQPYREGYVDVNSANRIHVLQSSIPKTVYAGAPYLGQLKDGTWLLSCQTTLGRGTNWQLSTMEMAIGSDLATLKLVPRPFNIPGDKGALWNAFCILEDDSIIALTSTNAFNDYGAIWMIRGSIIRNK